MKNIPKGFKKIFVFESVLVPKNIRWTAIQPWGELLGFPKKPELFQEKNSSGQVVDEYWNLQNGEIPIISTEGIRVLVEDWRRSATKVK